nr:hypothetical protein [Tanacetum cinerariifolium]
MIEMTLQKERIQVFKVSWIQALILTTLRIHISPFVPTSDTLEEGMVQAGLRVACLSSSGMESSWIREFVGDKSWVLETPSDSYLVSDVVQAIDCGAKAADLDELRALLPCCGAAPDVPVDGGGGVSQPQSSHVVHAGPNLEHMDLEATDTSTQQNYKQMDEEFTTTAYPNAQKNLKLPSKDPVILKEPASSTGTLSSLEAKVQSMVLVPIHQDTSSIPPMTTSIIDLMMSESGFPLPTSTSIITISIITTTTSLPPPSQQRITDPILVKRIGKLEQHMADLLQYNLSPEKVDEIVTDAVDWVMQALLRARFSDLPAVDIKEILQHRMFKDKSYEAHKDQKNLYDAMQKSLERDYSNQLLSNLYEARQKKRKRRDLPRTPYGSPLSQPPPLPPPVGTSGALGSKALSSSKSAASAPQSMAWTTSDTRYESDGVSRTQECWHKWATALVSAYETPAENSLLAKTGDMTNFLNWYCRQVNKNELTQADLEGQAYEVVKAFYPDVIHLQFQIEECHKMLTDQVNWTNPEGDQVRVDVN